MEPASQPRTLELSVIALTPDRYETVRKTIRHLRAQTRCERMEIVLVAPSRAALAVDEGELAAFGCWSIVEVGDLVSSAQARALGVRHARAPVVAFVEDHSYPAPGWLEALLRAHRDACAAVGPAIANGNPRTLVSWANLLIEYGPWLAPQASGPVEHLPGHNGSYKRDALVAYGEALATMLEAESVLHWDLRARGHVLRLEPAARTFHVNFSRWADSIPLRFQAGRLFGAARARRWRPGRRLLYAAAAPLVPLVRLRRALRDARRTEHCPPPWRLVAALLALLAVDAVGELVGYLTGPGRAMARTSAYEFHRERYLAARDGARPAPASAPPTAPA
jgi:hypothetical protein